MGPRPPVKTSPRLRRPSAFCSRRSRRYRRAGPAATAASLTCRAAWASGGCRLVEKGRGFVAARPQAAGKHGTRQAETMRARSGNRTRKEGSLPPHPRRSLPSVGRHRRQESYGVVTRRSLAAGVTQAPEGRWLQDAGGGAPASLFSRVTALPPPLPRVQLPRAYSSNACK